MNWQEEQKKVATGVTGGQELVAVMQLHTDGWDLVEGIDTDWLETLPFGTTLYTHPQPKREWVGLTDDEIDEGLLRSDYVLQTAHAWRAGVVFAMTKLKEKNT